MSRLLLNEYPLMVSPTLASKIGLNESLILQQIHYWLEINRKAKKNFINGFYWTYNTYNQWQEQFPFWSTSTIKRTISNLEKLGLIISENHNTLKIDRTKWYRIDYANLDNVENSPLCQNEPMDRSKRAVDSIKMNQPLPETNTETTSETINIKPVPHSHSSSEGYINLAEENDSFIQLYIKLLKEYGLESGIKRISQSNLDFVYQQISAIEEIGISEEEVESVIDEYLSYLPTGNDGNIVPFLMGYKRHFKEYL